MANYSFKSDTIKQMMQRPRDQNRGPQTGGGGALGPPMRPRTSVGGGVTEYGGASSSVSRSLSYSSSESLSFAAGTKRRNSVGKMIKRAYATGYDECMKMIGELKDGPEQLFVVFLGTKGPTGRNWCPDCVIGEDLIEKCLDKLEKDVIILYVDVGERVFWKALDNIWRKDKILRLSNIPTIIEWRKKLRLEGEQCLHLDMIQMYFEGD